MYCRYADAVGNLKCILRRFIRTELKTAKTSEQQWPTSNFQRLEQWKEFVSRSAAVSKYWRAKPRVVCFLWICVCCRVSEVEIELPSWTLFPFFTVSVRCGFHLQMFWWQVMNDLNFHMMVHKNFCKHYYCVYGCTFVSVHHLQCLPSS